MDRTSPPDPAVMLKAQRAITLATLFLGWTSVRLIEAQALRFMTLPLEDIEASIDARLNPQGWK